MWKLYLWDVEAHHPILPSLKLTAKAPENGGPLEKEIPDLETTISRGELLVLGSVWGPCISLMEHHLSLNTMKHIRPLSSNEELANTSKSKLNPY